MECTLPPSSKVAAFSINLVAGLIVSQVIGAVLDEHAYEVWTEVVTLATMWCLAFIMINVGYEFTIDKSALADYGIDYLVAMTAASFPWGLVGIWFVIFLEMPVAEALLIARFAAPTSAGILFSMLAAAGLKDAWVFQKARVLAIFDDLDTIILMIPLKIILVGFKWELSVSIGIMVALLVVAWFKLHCLKCSYAWHWNLVYSAIIAGICKFIHHATHHYVHDMEPIHIEVLLPAFVWGCLVDTPAARHELALQKRYSQTKRLSRIGLSSADLQSSDAADTLRHSASGVSDDSMPDAVGGPLMRVNSKEAWKDDGQTPECVITLAAPNARNGSKRTRKPSKGQVNVEVPGIPEHEPYADPDEVDRLGRRSPSLGSDTVFTIAEEKKPNNRNSLTVPGENDEEERECRKASKMSNVSRCSNNSMSSRQSRISTISMTRYGVPRYEILDVDRNSKSPRRTDENGSEPEPEPSDLRADDIGQIGSLNSVFDNIDMEEVVQNCMSMVFMVLVGFCMPAMVGKNATDESDGLSPFVVLLHILGVSFLMVVGKMFCVFCYREEATWEERLALSFGMCPRGEVGASIIVISLDLGVSGPSIIIAVVALGVNLVMSGGFIALVKFLIRRGIVRTSKISELSSSTKDVDCTVADLTEVEPPETNTTVNADDVIVAEHLH